MKNKIIEWNGTVQEILPVLNEMLRESGIMNKAFVFVGKDGNAECFELRDTGASS